MLHDLLFRSERRRFIRSDANTSDGSTTSPQASTQNASSSSLSLSAKSTTLPDSNVTDPTLPTTNTTYLVTTAAHDDKSPFGIIIAVLITVILVCIVVTGIICLMKKNGLWEKIFGPTIRRRSSTSGSRRPLDTDYPEAGSQAPDHSVQGEPDDAFTIEEFEEDDFHNARPDREEYFYDEVFGQSQFEDERTKNAVRQLVSESEAHDHEDELLDFDFETLGIKIDSHKMDDSRHRHV